MPDANWTLISGYTPQDYTDTAVFEVNSDTKKITLITGQALVAGEENSQYIRFVLDRYWDGIDIKDKAFYVEYALAGQYYGKTAAVNAEYTAEQVRFGWVVPEEACCIAGTLLFVLRVESEGYILKTQIAEHPVFKSVNAGDVVPEPTKEVWYREFEARVEAAIDDAEAAIEAAQAAQMAAELAAQNSHTSEENAEAAAATAQTTAEIAAQEAVEAWADDHEAEIVNGYVTPEMYGAQGDGIADDTEAIQSALNSEEDVYFGRKTYCVSETLTLSRSVSIGSDTTIKAIAAMDSVFSATNVGDRLRFIGGVVDCNGLADSGISLTGVNGAYIQNSKILNAAESGIVITDGSHNWILGCKIYNQLTLANGITSNSPDLKVSDCEIYYTSCGIEQTYGILFVSNTHIWSGGAQNVSTTSVGIQMSVQTNPRLLANNLYLDSFYTAVDFGTAVGKLKMSECLFYWATTTTPQECYGVKAGANSEVNLSGCIFQTYSPIVKHDIQFGTQIIDYSEPKKDATSDFAVTTNASKTILTATVIKGILYIDFVVKILALTADSTNWYPIIESGSLPKERMLASRLDFSVYNNTKAKGAVGRVGVFTADNIIRIHINGDLSVNDVIYGSTAIPIV